MDSEVNYILWSRKEFLKRAEGVNNLLRNIFRSPVIMLVGSEKGFRGIVEKRRGAKPII